MELKLDFSFNSDTYRHYLNGFLTVLHCHHYLCLTTKMAEDFDDLGGIRILTESAENAIKPMLDDYAMKQGISDYKERLMVAVQYFSVMGLGKMIVVNAKEKGGEVHLEQSHLDQGWIKKWGADNTHHNHFSRGFIAAVFASTFEKSAGSYEVEELKSIVTGAKKSVFQIRLKK